MTDTDSKVIPINSSIEFQEKGDKITFVKPQVQPGVFGHPKLNMFILSTAVLIGASAVSVLALLRYTPERWASLDVKIWGLRLQASESDAGE